jgi:hypothetical protein
VRKGMKSDFGIMMLQEVCDVTWKKKLNWGRDGELIEEVTNPLK